MKHGSITTKTCAYTNHTIMAEALEKWPIEIFSRLLPRIYQIVEEINRRFILKIQEEFPNDGDKIRKMAIIYDGQVKHGTPRDRCKLFGQRCCETSYRDLKETGIK